ncbi:hypothetical protein DPX16_21115 [Anabarilius grahami]|uniref:Uncharacterized protein n=1 Tax=Anabarilius grahami TaxID=495550 RepID=A0A3N0Z4G9_ANAGA|nr:hypothetical protein DPX16_21115 [Anabarilius grahami]
MLFFLTDVTAKFGTTPNLKQIVIGRCYEYVTLVNPNPRAALWSCPVEDRIHHAGMDGLLRNCATGCRVDEAFTMDDLVDSISADTSGLRCGHVQLRIVFITPVWTVC